MAGDGQTNLKLRKLVGVVGWTHHLRVVVACAYW